jgi:Glu-tRNA(Gln) amidotransferase subunit E-like FAD-binding protein
MLDVLHGGFDRLLTAGVQEFYKWLNDSREAVQRVLEQRASTVWREYVSAASRFPTIRIKTMEVRRRREMSRRTRERSKMDTRHWEQMLERRVALELVREAMAAELRVLRQDKYGWILHAESGWADHLQQLVHERAIWPIIQEVCDEEPDWQLCPTEGPYRMRKKLERRKKKLNILGKPQLMVHL